jgi:hypothetical protein
LEEVSYCFFKLEILVDCFLARGWRGNTIAYNASCNIKYFNLMFLRGKVGQAKD